MSYRLSEPQVAQYHRDGYILVPSLFTAEEIGLLQNACKADPAFQQNVLSRRDGEGGSVDLAIWNHPGDDLYGVFSSCERMVNSAEQLMGEEVYHYHSKLILKRPRIGGAWTWHQDYGYWYNNGCLFPQMLSCMIAVDRSRKENGCLQVLKGSHHLGRIDHGHTGDQTGANLERVEQAGKVCELVYAEMNPGDALFFHCNTLHRSDQNKSDDPRLTLISCYNAARNSPYKTGRHPQYTPLKRVPDTRILETGVKLAKNASFITA